MLYHISKLHRDEQELVKKAPLLVSILISGADGEVDPKEINKAVKLIHTKSFAETSDIRHLYKEIDHDVESSLNLILKGLPADPEEREKRISEELEGLNRIMEKLDLQVATDFYHSLKSFALRVALNSEGVSVMMKINHHAKELVELPMLHLPGH